MNAYPAEMILEVDEIMSLDLAVLLDTMANAIIAGAAELTELDSAIGDADHGLNMKRGFEAVRSERANILAKPLPDAISAVGYALVMNNPSPADLGRSLVAAGAAVSARGKAEIGSKTILDVLLPVAAHVASGTATFESIRQLAAASAVETIAMKALRGRASFLGERSIGHMDPGAKSCEILIAAACDALEGMQ